MKQTEIQLEEIKKFLSEAWCVDGPIETHFVEIKEKTLATLFELCDSKRGRFGIILLPEKELNIIKWNQ